MRSLCAAAHSVCSKSRVAPLPFLFDAAFLARFFAMSIPVFHLFWYATRSSPSRSLPGVESISAVTDAGLEVRAINWHKANRLTAPIQRQGSQGTTMSKFKPRPTYYTVHALRDGTIWFAIQTRKPKKSGNVAPQIDEDGVHDWYVDEDEPNRLSDWGKGLRHGAVANRLNTRRAIREQVEPKLDELLRLVGELGERLSRVEQLLAASDD